MEKNSKNDHHADESEFPWQENPKTTTTLNDLPDEILRTILSNLPFQDVAQTMLLSRAWRDIWNRIAVIHETGSLTAMDTALSRFLDRVFEPENRFHYQRKLEFDSPGGHKLIVAVGLRKNLHLEHLPNSSSNSIPNGVISKGKEAKLKSIRLTRLGNLFHHFVVWLLSLIPSLESIEMRKCEGVSMDVKLGVNPSNLERLSIIDCPVDSIEIRPDKLTSFRFRGRHPRMEICTHIKDVMLDFRECPLNNTFSKNFSKVAFIQFTERITLCRWTFEAMLRRHLDSFNEFKCLKELWWIDNSMGEEEIDSLITFLKDCPALEKLFVTIDPTCYGVGVPRNGGRRKALWKKRERLRHLTMVKMDFSENEEDMVRLADHILSISENEPEVVATSRTSSIVRRLVRVGPNRPRLFVEKGAGEMSSEMLNSRHAHMSELLGDRQV